MFDYIGLDYDIKYYGFKKTFRFKFFKFISKTFKVPIQYRKSSKKRVHIRILVKNNFLTNLLVRLLLFDDFNRIKHDIKRYLQNKENYEYYTNRLFDNKHILVYQNGKLIKEKHLTAGKWKKF